MTYTQEQINAMTAEQLKTAIVELQGQQAAAPAQEAVIPIVTAQDTDQMTENKTAVQTDIEKIEARIADLKADSEELYADAIKALEDKRDALVAEAKATVEQVETNVKNDVQEAETEVKTFWQKYGQAIAHGAEIILLGYIAGRLAGVL
jgi:hypothetical protein